MHGLNGTCTSGTRVIWPLFAICFLSGTTWGVTYFVDNSSGLCGDTPAHGTESRPFCTISYAIGRMRGGDVLEVKSGNYHETGLYIPGNRSGTAKKPTKIQTYPGAVVTIRGDGINTGRIKLTGCSNVTFDGFIVTDFNQGIYIEQSTNITVQNCTLHDIGQEGIHVNGNSDNVLIQNCVVRDTGKWIYNGEGIYVGTGSKGPVDNTAYVTIRSNLVQHPGTGYGGEAIELKPGTHDCVIEFNSVSDVRSESGAGAIEINESRLGVQSWPSNPNHVVRNNILHDMNIAIRAGTGCLIYNNVIYNIADGHCGIFVDNHAGDSYERRVYHNTMDLPSTNAINLVAGTTDIRNNIGPSLTNNVVTKASYFVDESRRDYHLVSGSAPVDAGVNLSDVVTTDFEGHPRTNVVSPDMGAFEFVPLQQMMQKLDSNW